MSDKKDTTQVDNTINNPDVVTKYKTAGEISAKVLSSIKALCVEGATVFDLCKEGDKQLIEATDKIYKGKKISKGIAFPTTVSPNNIVAHLSPLESEPEAKIELKNGDVVKLCLGAQIDGYGSIVGDTVVVGGDAATGRNADVIAAAWYASEAAIRTIKPGNKNFDVTKVVDQVCAEYGVTAMESMLSNEQKQNVVDGKKRIILNPTESQQREFETVTFEEGEVYGLDVLVTTGDGKCHGGEKPTTVFKKNDVRYELRVRASRVAFSEIQNKAGAFPFTLRSFDDIKKTRMGLPECINHQLITPYEVMYDKKDQVVAQFFTTIALTKTGTLKLAGAPVPDFEKNIKTGKKIDSEDLKQLIAQPLRPKKKNNKKAAEASA